MPMAYEAREPAAEPRPGPTGMSLSRAHWMKSAVMRKYDAKPSWLMVLTS